MKVNLPTIKTQEASNNLQRELGYSASIADILVNRGLDTKEKVQNFMDFNESNIPDLNLLPDITKAVERIRKAQFLNEHVGVYTDYDADGATSGSILVNGLRGLGIQTDFFTNDRFIEGFGMKPEGLRRFIKKYPDIKLIITSDNGIVAFDAVEEAKKMGIDVIITDHHEPDASGKIPDAIAVIDCKRYDNTYPFTECCGAGVAYKLIKKLYDELNGNPEILQKQLPLVALGTVADCMPLIEDNRFYVKEGLKLIGKSKIFNEFAYQLKINKFDEETLGFYLGPICNAQSRLRGNALLPISLFTCNENDTDFIKNAVEELINVNNERKLYTEEEFEKAEEIIKQNNLDSKNIIIVQDDSFKEGIVGIIAGRIVEKYNKPAIVFARTEGSTFKGSARSVEGLHIKEAFDKLADLILSYGGHAMAAGISIDEANFNILYKELDKMTQGINTQQNSNEIVIDAIIEPRDVNMKLIDEIELLKPFGEGWAPITFEIKNYIVEDKRLMKDIHLKLVNKDLNALIFNVGADIDKTINKMDNISLIGVPKANVFNGNVSYDVILKSEECIIK